jgi:hypothetical protein
MRSRPDRARLPGPGLTAMFASLLLVLSGVASAQQVRLLVQSSPLAGFRHHEAKAVLPMMKPGDALSLVREPDNSYDANAVRVEWQGRKLGYVPRRENSALAWAMDRGQAVSARVSRLQPRAKPRERIEFEVFVE